MDYNHYLTSKDCAKILHMNPRCARDLLKKNNVPMAKIGLRYLIPADEFYKFLQEKFSKKDAAK